MARNQTDLIDIGALIAIPFVAGMVLNVFTFALNVFGGFDFGQALWSSSGTQISVALVVFLAAWAWILATNEVDGSDYEAEEMAGMAFGIGVTPLYALVPGFRDLVASSDLFAFALYLIACAAAVYISYVE